MLYQPTVTNFYDFRVVRDQERCIKCQGCVTQCSFEANFWDAEREKIDSIHSKCVGCHRCEAYCPTDAISIQPNPSAFRPHGYWTKREIRNIYLNAETGAIGLTGMGNDMSTQPTYFDRMLFDACQVTNPSIDPLREPMELRTYMGNRGREVPVSPDATKVELSTKLSPLMKLDIPIIFGPMSFGSINLNVQKALAATAQAYGTYWSTGEGGLHRSLYKYGPNTIVQVASGRFGVHEEYLKAGGAIEIKIGQGAKPGIGGHLPGEKVLEEISKTRMIPVGSDAISPAPHHDIYSIEDLRQLIYALKEATRYEKPVSVKVAAVHNIAAIASGIARAGADVIVVDGYRGGTGATPTIVREHTGIPIEIAIAVVDDRLRQEGIRENVGLVAAGGIRSAADALKAIALGADAVYVASAALIAVGCTMCQQCHTGRCAWGITTNDPFLAKRQNPEIATERVSNMLRAWQIEMKEVLGSMGLNAIESLRGNRERLRAVGMTKEEMEVLGLKMAGIGM
ncbi:Glutamate synthase domain 2 [Brevinematales bacterium NS]|nr:4Fe-4S binding protein [Brevinematales bacterium]QJR22335.1 Glutamate synthase domain 2 [Brevinematales bacterium NS]